MKPAISDQHRTATDRNLLTDQIDPASAAALLLAYAVSAERLNQAVGSATGGDLTPTNTIVATVLLLNADSLRPSDLARRIGVKRSAMSKSLNRLVEAGFIDRHTPAGTDRRSTQVSLTPEGRAWLNNVLSAVGPTMHEIAEEFQGLDVVGDPSTEHSTRVDRHQRRGTSRGA